MNERQFIGRLLRASMQHEPSDFLRAVLDRNELNWRSIVHLADRHLVLPAVGDALCRLQLTSPDKAYNDFVIAMRDANFSRNVALRRQLLVFSNTLNESGIEPLVLKGAIRLVDDLYPSLAWRYLTDIDILTQARDIEVACQGFSKLGYIQSKSPSFLRESHHHLPAYFSCDWPAAVEVHTAFGVGGVSFLLPPEDIYGRSKLVRVEGVRFRIPSTQDQIVHAIAHAYLANSSFLYPGTSLRDIFETFLLFRREEQDIESLSKRFENASCSWALDSSRLDCSKNVGYCFSGRTSRFSRLLSFVGSFETDSRVLRTIRFVLAGVIRAALLEKRSPGAALRKLSSASYLCKKLSQENFTVGVKERRVVEKTESDR